MRRIFSRSLLLALATWAIGAVTLPAIHAEGEFSTNVALTTDYVWRGISQTEEDPAIQGGFDYTNSLFYAGIWASNVDFNSEADMEADLYAGLAGEFEGGLTWDVGAIGYLYPGESSLDFYEIYAGLGYEVSGVALGGYVYFDPDNESTYIEGKAAYSFTDAISADVSLGSFSFDGAGDYTNWSAGGTYRFDWVDVDLRYWDTNIANALGIAEAEERVVLTVSKSFQ